MTALGLPKCLLNTFCNTKWIVQHTEALKKALPQEWVVPRTADLLRFGYHLKLCSCDWQSERDLIRALVLTENIGLLLRETQGAETKIKVNLDWSIDQISSSVLNPNNAVH